MNEKASQKLFLSSWVMLRVYIFNEMPVPFRCLGLDLKMPEISQLAALLIDLVKECYFYYCKVLSTIAFKTWSIVLIRLNTVVNRKYLSQF